MSDIILETRSLGISFGGLKALEAIDLKIKKKQYFCFLIVVIYQSNFIL